MSIDPAEGCEVLREVVLTLLQSKLKYWIGRGVFRHFVLHGNFGDGVVDHRELVPLFSGALGGTELRRARDRSENDLPRCCGIRRVARDRVGGVGEGTRVHRRP